jgi:hypothetical protein
MVCSIALSESNSASLDPGHIAGKMTTVQKDTVMLCGVTSKQAQPGENDTTVLL